MTSTRIKAVIFDLDDTLWPLEAALQRAEDTLHAWLSIHTPGITERYTQAELRAMRMALRQTAPRFQHDLWSLRHESLLQACRSCNENDALMQQAMEVFSTARNAVTPFKDVEPGLVQLKEQHAIGSISNGFADLKAIGLAHHFDASFAAHTFGCAKPDPAIFVAACDALNVSPQEALYIGDDPLLDVQGARNAGLQAGWMDRFNRPFPHDIGPAMRFASLHEIHHWLQEREPGSDFVPC